MLRLGVVADAPLAQRLERRLARLLHCAPPLERDERLDPGVAALTGPDGVPVALSLLELTALAQPLDDALVGLGLGKPGKLAGGLVHPAVGADHGQNRQVVAPADLEVGRVVTRGHLERAGTEVRLDRLVGDHRHAALDERDDDLPADRVAVTLVLGMHRDRDVGEDRLRPHGRDRERPIAVGEQVLRIRQGVVYVLVHDLEVRDRRLVERAPVDDPVRAIDPPSLPEVHEEAHHRLDVGVVHREPLARVVERAAEPAELGHDRAPGLVEVPPHALDERFAADVLPRRTLADELFLDDVLRRDPGVVVPGLPQRVEAPHPVQADEQVLDRAVQCVAHVQRAGDVRRWHADHERPVVASPGPRAVEAFVLPRALPAILDALRGVERLHQAAIVVGGTDRPPTCGSRACGRAGRPIRSCSDYASQYA